jgi:hypothetical protein
MFHANIVFFSLFLGRFLWGISGPPYRICWLFFLKRYRYNFGDGDDEQWEGYEHYEDDEECDEDDEEEPASRSSSPAAVDLSVKPLHCNAKRLQQERITKEGSRSS